MGRIATLKEVKEGKEVYLVCQGNGLVITSSTLIQNPLHAIANHADEFCYFEFIEIGAGSEKYFIESGRHLTTVTAIGDGYPLFPQRGPDVEWSKFKIFQANDGVSINIQLKHPIVQNEGCWASAIGETYLIRLAERTPVKGWSDFMPHLRY